MPLWAMAFSECRMRLTALEVNVSICVSVTGCTTSDSRNTFFLPLGPAALQHRTTVAEQGSARSEGGGGHQQGGVGGGTHLVCAAGRMGSGSFLVAGASEAFSG